MVGVPRATLLAWERRYAVVEPTRQDNGYRAYSDDDVAVLRAVKGLVDQGLKVSEAVSRIRERGRKPATAAAPNRALDDLRNELRAALMDFDRDRALACAQRVGLMSFDVQLQQLYGPLLREVGEAWHDGKATISQEHYTAGFVRERVTAMLVALNSGPRGGGRVLCAGYDDDLHELPVLILAVHLALAGFRATPIGVLVPVGALARAVQDTEAKLVSVTATTPRPLAEVERFLATLLESLPADCVVAVGGPGVPPGLQETDRVRVPPTVEALVELGRSLPNLR